MQLGLETESMHLWFQNARMDIFSFIELAHSLNLDGVVINIIKDYGLNPNWGCLGSNEEEHLRKVRGLLDKYNMYCEIDSKGFELGKFEQIARVARILDACIIRSYVPLSGKKTSSLASKGAFDDSKIDGDFDKADFLSSAEQIKALLPLLEANNLRLAIENHEYQTSEDLLELLSLVGSERVGFLFDFGNSMMAYEEPVKACYNMASKVISTHCKDHVIMKEEDAFYVCGVPIGQGFVDVKACIDILKAKGLGRINIEMCFPYCSSFKRKKGTGGVSELGQGAFRVRDPLFAGLSAMQYYYPQEVSEEALNRLLKVQLEGVKSSVEHVRGLI